MLQARARALQQRSNLYAMFGQSRPQADFVPHFFVPISCCTGTDHDPVDHYFAQSDEYGFDNGVLV